MRKIGLVLMFAILSLAIFPHQTVAAELPVLQVNQLSVSKYQVTAGDYLTITVELEEKIENELVFIEYVDPIYGYYEEIYLTNFDNTNVYTRDLEITTERNSGSWVVDSIHTIDEVGNITASVYNNLIDYGNTQDLSSLVYEVAQSKPIIKYQTHVQKIGWQDYRNEYEMSGTAGRALRLEAIRISLDTLAYGGGISYSTHVQGIGWQAPVYDDSLSGTSGQSRRLEAIKVNLTGPVAEYYDIYYRVHAQTFGWLGWAKNGQPAGTAGYAKRLEGIEIMLAPRGQDIGIDTSRSFVQ